MLININLINYEFIFIYIYIYIYIYLICIYFIYLNFILFNKQLTDHSWDFQFLKLLTCNIDSLSFQIIYIYI